MKFLLNRLGAVSFGGLVTVALMAGFGCGLSDDVDKRPVPAGGGGDQPATAASTFTTGAGGGPCTAASECPDPENECVERTCETGVCRMKAAAAGTLKAAQIPGDCLQLQCDGAGTTVAVTDDSDVPADDGDVGTCEVCTAGVPSHPTPLPGAVCDPGSEIHPWKPAQLGAAWIMDPALFTVSGSSITAAADAGGGSIVLTAASGNEPVLVTNGPFTGKSALRTSNPATRLFSASGGVTGNQPWHLVSIFERLSACDPAGASTFAQFGSPGPASADNVGLGSTKLSLAVFGNGNSGTNQVPSATPYLDALPHIVEAKFDGTDLSVNLDGKLLAGPFAKTYAITDAAFGFMSWYGAYLVQDARVHSLAFGSNKNFTQPQVNAFLRYEIARLGGTGRILALFGDSTTQGTTVGARPLDQSIRAAQVYPNVIFPSNQGVSGERPAQIVTRLLAYPGPSTHIVLWCGRNLTLTPVTPAIDAADAYAQITMGVARIHALGSRAIVGTLDQWGLSPTGSYTDDFRLAFNALILANGAGAEVVVDISTLMGAYSPASYTPDTIHPSAAALDTIIGPAFYTAAVSI